jgi:protein-disulfide isomerase
MKFLSSPLKPQAAHHFRTLNISSKRFHGLKRLVLRLLGVSALTFVMGSLIWAQDLNTRGLARVGDVTITRREVDETIPTQVYALEKQLYALRKAALDNLVIRKLLESEAQQKGVTVDALKQEMLAGPVSVTRDEVANTYEQNAPAFGLLSPDEAREKIRLDLEAQTRLRRYREKLDELRKKTRIEVFLEEPRLVLTMSRDSLLSSTGPADAPVVITEFSDFQCPYCRDAQPIVKQLLIEYAGRIRVDFKYLPLPIHPLALAAAESAYCAAKQNAFWKFHDRLFEAQTLTQVFVRQLPEQLNLDSETFQRCLVAPETQASISRDSAEARRLGVNATPSFVVNGKLYSGLIGLEQFRLIVAKELDLALSDLRKQKPQPQPQKELKK